MDQNNNMVKSENYFIKNENRKKSFCSVINSHNKINHVVQIDIKIDEVYISIYKLEKIYQIFKSNTNSISKKENDLDKESGGVEGNKATELKDQAIFKNLKTILMIKDSEVNLSFGLNKGQLKFQDIRNKTANFNEFVELCVEDVRLETVPNIPIKFDFSELRYIEQLENIMNYVQYDIKFDWKFNASYTNMMNKQVEPFVEEMNVSLKLK